MPIQSLGKTEIYLTIYLKQYIVFKLCTIHRQSTIKTMYNTWFLKNNIVQKYLLNLEVKEGRHY